jgi:hypothetical protein
MDYLSSFDFKVFNAARKLIVLIIYYTVVWSQIENVSEEIESHGLCLESPTDDVPNVSLWIIFVNLVFVSDKSPPIF